VRFKVLIQLLAGTFLVTATVLIHATVHELLYRVLKSLIPKFKRGIPKLWKVPTIVTSVLGTLGAVILEIWMWAFFFLSVKEPALANIEQALYFSTTTFTTVGFGDIILSQKWRLLSSFESAIGLVMFGWSTAFLMEILSSIDLERPGGRLDLHQKQREADAG
jgi:hypothetical protein